MEHYTDADLILIDMCPACGKHIHYAHGDDEYPDVVTCIHCPYNAIKVGDDWVRQDSEAVV